MMAKESAIEWTDATWNPWMGCTKVSAGCQNCYMFREQKRYGHDPTKIRRSKTTFRDPLKWKEPKHIFVCSWSDFFHEDVPPEWRRDAWEIMYHARGQGHTFLPLTKRPENIASMLPIGWIEGMHEYWPHVWFGATVENQESINRLSEFYNFPASRTFLSAEPLLGPLDLSEHMGFIDWVIVGGESGPNVRPMKEEWATDIRDQCIEHGVPFFFKQWSGVNPKKDPRGMMLDGKIWKERPK